MVEGTPSMGRFKYKKQKLFYFTQQKKNTVGLGICYGWYRVDIVNVLAY